MNQTRCKNHGLLIYKCYRGCNPRCRHGQLIYLCNMGCNPYCEHGYKIDCIITKIISWK